MSIQEIDHVNINIFSSIFKIKKIFFFYQVEICRKHFDELLYIYEKQVCINLINQSGSEGKLEKTFSEVVKTLNDPLIR